MTYAHSCPVVSGRSVYKLGIGSFLFIVLSGRTAVYQERNGRCLNTTIYGKTNSTIFIDFLYLCCFFLYPVCINQLRYEVFFMGSITMSNGVVYQTADKVEYHVLPSVKEERHFFNHSTMHQPEAVYPVDPALRCVGEVVEDEWEIVQYQL